MPAIGVLNADPVHGNLLPARRLQGGLAPYMPNAKGAYEHAPFPLAKHRVPHGGGVAGTLDLMPRLRWRVVANGLSGLDQLGARGHPAVLSVDEEPGHGKDFVTDDESFAPYSAGP